MTVMLKQKGMTKEEKLKQMTETPVEKLIPRLAIPTIISMLVTSIYNMADTFFVSQIGTSASGAVGIMFSAMAMIQAIGFTLGMGSEIIFPDLLETEMMRRQAARHLQPFLQRESSAFFLRFSERFFQSLWYIF